MNLTELLEQLEEQYGPTAEYIFELGIRNAITSGIGWSMMGIVAFGIAIALAIAARRYLHSGDYDPGFGAFLLSAGSVGVGTLALMFLFQGVGKLLNPEYSALLELLRAI